MKIKKFKLFYIIIKLSIIVNFLFYNNLKKIFIYNINTFNDYIFLKELKIFLNVYLNLKDISYVSNDILIKEEKLNILKLFSKPSTNKKNNLKTIFYSFRCRFGNLLINLNKLIFYCEIIGCNKIILEKKLYWFIKNKIKIQTKNITIEVKNKKDLKKDCLHLNTKDIFYYFYKIKPEIRIHYLRNEIIRNLPNVKTSKNNLYIHIRSGDIFQKKIPHIYYTQPPLCFYREILNNYKFNKVYLICEDKSNPIIDKLIYDYPNIIYENNSFPKHLSLLVNAYNIVSSISSFLYSIIQLNYNLEFLWDYNILKTLQKIKYFHYDLYKYPHYNFTIFRMEPSPIYKLLMNNWKNNKKQRKLMFKEKCINKFFIIQKI